MEKLFISIHHRISQNGATVLCHGQKMVHFAALHFQPSAYNSRSLLEATVLVSMPGETEQKLYYIRKNVSHCFINSQQLTASQKISSGLLWAILMADFSLWYLNGWVDEQQAKREITGHEKWLVPFSVSRKTNCYALKNIYHLKFNSEMDAENVHVNEITMKISWTLWENNTTTYCFLLQC